MLTAIPKLLIELRFILAGLLLWDAADGYTSTVFVSGYIVAILSDIFDGVIARRLGVSTPQLRQADSWADICLFLALALSTWWTYPEVLAAFALPLLVAVLGQCSLFVLCLVKFQKMPSYHTYTAKAWGLGLAIATVSLHGFNIATPLWLAIGLCWLNTFEEIAMTLILKEWHCDVLSFFHAQKIA